jgi:GNAT superfamily N-acetyltransferase
LVTQWGYPADRDAIARRLCRMTGDADITLVAVVHAEVAGWVHVGLYPTLAADDAAELRGLVVDEKWQRQGVGRQLMHAAEEWALRHGCRTIYVRSRISRREAHAFYRHLGYRQIKTSFTFVRTLDDT